MKRQGRLEQRNESHRFVWWLLVAWVSASCVGILLQLALHASSGIEISFIEHVLDSFDKLFKMAGGLFVGLAWSARIVIKSCMYGFSHSSITSSEHIWFPAILYTFQGIIRAWIYKAHTVFIDSAGHLMSDHVFLSSSIVAGLVCEIYLIATSKILQSRKTLGTLLLYTLAGILSVILFLLIMHVYKTARYHHSPFETGASVILGSILFKLTMYLSLHHRLVAIP